MHWLFTLLQTDDRSLFPADLDHALFLSRLVSLARRWHVGLRAFGLAGPQAQLLLDGSAAAVGHVCRLQQSGWGVWRHHRGDFVCWEPSVREWVGDDAQAGAVADHLHRQGGLAWPWTSLRDVLGLRTAGWIDTAWYRERRTRAELLRAAEPGLALPLSVSPAWRSPQPLPWACVEGALLHVTGLDPTLRGQRVLRTRLGWAGGWSVRAIAEDLGVQPRAVSRALRRGPDPAVARGRVLLHDSRLRPAWLLGVGERATAADLEVPCLATPSSWRVLAR